MPGSVRGETLDPDHRSDQLNDLPETRQHTDHENKADEPVQPDIRQKNRRHLRIGNIGTHADQSQNDEHRHDLTVRLGEDVRLGLAIRLIHQGPVLSLFSFANNKARPTRCQPE